MKATTLVLASGIMLIGAGMSACHDPWKVKRENPTTETDVDYRFNDTDARGTAGVIINDILSQPWITNWSKAHNGQAPIVFVGNIRNDTQDYNAKPELFTSAIVRELINSGRVRVKTERDAREELRDERLDTKFNDPATVKAVAKELNADFALTGDIQQVVQRDVDDEKLVNYYQINTRLTDVESAEVVWQGRPVEIKKTATR